MVMALEREGKIKRTEAKQRMKERWGGGGGGGKRWREVCACVCVLGGRRCSKKKQVVCVCTGVSEHFVRKGVLCHNVAER